MDEVGPVLGCVYKGGETVPEENMLQEGVWGWNLCVRQQRAWWWLYHQEHHFGKNGIFTCQPVGVLEERDGAIVSAGLIEELGWKVQSSVCAGDYSENYSYVMKVDFL